MKEFAAFFTPQVFYQLAEIVQKLDIFAAPSVPAKIERFIVERQLPIKYISLIVHFPAFFSPRSPTGSKPVTKTSKKSSVPSVPSFPSLFPPFPT